MSEEYLTVIEVINELNVDFQTVRRMTNEGSLPAVRMPEGNLKYRRSDVEAFKSEPNFNKPFLTTFEIARMTGWCTSTVKRFFDEGFLTNVGAEDARKATKEEVDAMLPYLKRKKEGE